jgi:hypothetical protein
MLVTAILAVVVAAATFLTAWANGVNWRIALAPALGTVAATIAAGFGIRGQVTAPATLIGNRSTVDAQINDAVVNVYKDMVPATVTKAG